MVSGGIVVWDDVDRGLPQLFSNYLVWSLKNVLLGLKSPAHYVGPPHLTLSEPQALERPDPQDHTKDTQRHRADTSWDTQCPNYYDLGCVPKLPIFVPSQLL